MEIKIEKLNQQIKAQVETIKKLINQGNDFYTEIRMKFNHIIKSVLNVPAIISIYPNKQGNIEFHADIQDPENMEATTEGMEPLIKILMYGF